MKSGKAHNQLSYEKKNTRIYKIYSSIILNDKVN